MAKNGRAKPGAKGPKEAGTKTVLAHDLIGRKLREFYDDVSREPVPDRFTALLEKLERESSRKKPS